MPSTSRPSVCTGGPSLLPTKLPAMAETSTAAPAAAAPAPLKKGSLVRVNRQAYASSLEAAASDSDAPDYIFEGPGEILAVKGEYAQLRWRRPVPDVWLRMDQLEAFPV